MDGLNKEVMYISEVNYTFFLHTAWNNRELEVENFQCTSIHACITTARDGAYDSGGSKIYRKGEVVREGGGAQ